DANGIVWPFSVAPYQVHLVPVNLSHEPTREAAESIYGALSGWGVEVLLDDRDERPGAKFKDADLIGVPLRVTIGEKGLKDGIVELRDRKTGSTDRLPVAEAAVECRKRVGEALTKLSSPSCSPAGGSGTSGGSAPPCAGQSSCPPGLPWSIRTS